MLDDHPVHDYGVGYYFREIGMTDAKGFFGFARAISNFRFEAEWDSAKNLDFNRCDNGAPRNLVLPSGFHEWNYELEECSCGSSLKPYGTTNDHHVCLTACRVFRVPIQTRGGFIAYFEYHNLDNEAIDMQNSECNGRTLQEVFRCILEWQWVHLNMGNNEIVAVAANDFVNEITIPDDIKQWLWDAVPDQHVARYLRGVDNPRYRADTELVPDLTDEFNIWLDIQITQSPTLWPYGPR